MHIDGHRRQPERGTVADAVSKPARPFNPHDLLWAVDAASFSCTGDLPDWASSAWLAKVPAVVRREKIAALDCIPVGLRGTAREQRHGAYLRRDRMARRVTPEMLAQTGILDGARRFGRFDAIDTLLRIAPRLDALNLAWGPTGSVGFALASGISVIRSTSDLDLVVRAPVMPDAGTIKALRALDSHASCRLDIQIDTGRGAFSVAEWFQGKRRILLKTDSGPLLTDSPWGEQAGTAEATA